MRVAYYWMGNSTDYAFCVPSRFELECCEMSYDILSSRELLSQSPFFKFAFYLLVSDRDKFDSEWKNANTITICVSSEKW